MLARLVDRPNRHGKIGIREHADGNGDHLRHRREFEEDCPAALRTEREDPFFPVIGDAYVFAAATFGAQLRRIEARLDAEGAAGSLLMPFYSAYPFVGQVFVLMAFVAVVLGTLGNVIGALVASLMMGVAESLGIQFVGADSGLIVVFAMLLLTLAFKPTGLGGGRAR